MNVCVRERERTKEKSMRYECIIFVMWRVELRGSGDDQHGGKYACRRRGIESEKETQVNVQPSTAPQAPNMTARAREGERRK